MGITDSWGRTLGAFALLALAVLAFMTTIPVVLVLLLLIVLLLVGIFTRLGRRHS